MIPGVMLDRLTAADFAPHLGADFRLHADDTTVLEAELIDVQEGAPTVGTRTPFSLVFRGPLEPLLPQAIYRFEHDTLDPFEVFIVPIGPDEAGMRYEVVFT
jgi:hypothetical protein